MKLRTNIMARFALQRLAAFDGPATRQSASLLKEQQRLLAEASAYLTLFYRERDIPASTQRLAQVRSELAQSGTYRQEYDELMYGTKVAWRNSTRCIGRLHWTSLGLRDMRHLTKAEDIFEALVEHMRLATNAGKIRALITIFAPQEPGQPGIRIWNSQLIRYAGYKQPDGSVVGDPAQVQLTRALLHLGWQGGRQQTPFDILPLAIQMPYEAPRLFEIPRDAILEVPISHPIYPWFADLRLKWHALPVISNMRLEIGGISYNAAPFNGWYMGAEIAARNLGDRQRYNLLPLIAELSGLDTRLERSLWKDRALVELNIAVLHSFAQHGVTVVDHHTASRQFVIHEERECKAGRALYADWGWIVPPLSASTTPVFHRSYEDRIQTPNFFYQPDPWAEIVPATGICTANPVKLPVASKLQSVCPIRDTVELPRE